MKKTFLRLIGAVLAVLLVLGSMSLLLNYRYADSITSLRRFYEQEENTVDVLGLGTSHVYEGLCPAVLYQEYGIAAYDLCAPAQRVWNSYYYFVEALKTQKPKAVVFDVYMLNTTTEFDTTANAIKSTYGMNWSKNKIDAMKASFPEEEFPEIFFEFFQYHSRYGELSQANTWYDAGDPAYYGDSYKGYYCYDTIQEISRPDPYSQTGTREFPEKYERYFRAIIELAVENQIPIYIVSIPYAIASDTQRTVNTAEQITKEYSSEYVHFIDFNKRYDEMGLDFSTDFSGIQHLNDNGAIKFTRYFGKILKEELDLPDHRSDARYASWEENARIFYRLYQNNDVKNVTDLFEYVELLHSLGDGYQIILVQNTNISKESAMSIQTGAAVFPEGKELSDEEKQSLLEYREAVCNAQTPNTFMETLFPDKEQWTFGGAWYWTEDGMEAIGENSSKFEKYIAYDQKNNLMLRSTTTTGEDDTYYHCELAYNGETQTSNLGLTFFVYDTDLNRLVDCVTFRNASTAGTRK